MPELPPLEFVSHAPDESDRLAGTLAPLLRPGDVILLHGQLGAGKTRFVQGLAAACGCDQAFVNSPTFVLVQEYDGRLPIYHVDAYRLRQPQEFLDLGGDELLDAGGVTCIEWAERLKEVLPAEALSLSISATGPTERRFVLSGTGRSWEARWERLRWALDRCIAQSTAGPAGPAPG